MDDLDKAKLKVLIKMILIQRSPNYLTSNKLADIINGYDWGFRTSITSSIIGKLLSMESKKSTNSFLDCIKSKKKRGILVYYYSNG